jgi:hypothetical protein
MSDTIEWLETIGRNAHLRHASADALAQTLERTDASDALKAAVAAGNSAPLVAEFGEVFMVKDHHSKAPGHEDEEPGNGQEQPPKPGQSEPSPDR